MPSSKSAIKRMRSDAKKRARKQASLSELKTLSQKLLSLASKPEEARTYSRIVMARFDRAASRGIIPKGRANRKKARVEKFLKKISSKKTSKK